MTNDNDDDERQMLERMHELLGRMPLVCAALTQLPPADELHQALVQGLHQQVRETGGCRPMLTFICPTVNMADAVHDQPYTQLILDCAPFMADDRLKNLLSDFGHWLLAKLGAVACAFVSEVWFSHVHGLGPGERPDRPPSEDPNRMEALVFHFEYQPDTRLFELYPIERQGDQARLGPKLEQPEGMTMEGRLCHWLPVLH